jgi:hypothetical protein
LTGDFLSLNAGAEDEVCRSLAMASVGLAFDLFFQSALAPAMFQSSSQSLSRIPKSVALPFQAGNMRLRAMAVERQACG